MFSNMLKFDSNNLSFYFRNHYSMNNFRTSANNKKSKKKSMNRLHKLRLFIIKVKHFHLQPKHKNRHWCNCFLIILSWQFCAYYFVLTKEWIVTRRNWNEFAMNLILIYIKHDNVILLAGSKWYNIKNDLSWVS